MSFIQLEGTAKFGADSGSATEFGSAITNLVIIRQRLTVTDPATWADAQERERAGAHKNMLQINFKTSPLASSFWAELWDALDTDSGELYWESTLTSAAVGPDNPKFSGTIVVLGLETGGTAGQLRTQQQTFPIVSTISKVTT